MPTQCDIARPAKQVYHEAIDAARLNMAHQTPSYRPAPAQSNHSSSRRGPPDLTSQSLPQSLWLSDVAEFTTSPPPLSQAYVGFRTALGTESISSASFSDSGQPSSRPLQRPRSRDYLLSASPTRPVTLSISGSHSRHLSPSPVPSSTHTLHSSRSLGAVSPHRTSASSPHAGGHLDLKRLMSKPAMQTSPGSVSLMHDSERSPGDPSTNGVDPSRHPSETAISRPPPSRRAHAPREKLSLHVNNASSRSSSATRRAQTSSPEHREPSGDSQAGKPSRNVLRRRSSARSNPSTPTVTNFRSATDSVFSPPARSASIKQPDSGVPPVVQSGRSLTSPFTRGPQAPTPPRAKTLSSPSISHVPVGLTPAGAVALAYKQQEQRREELAETASFNDAYQPPPANRYTPASPERLESRGAEDGDGTGGPYYTVFGGASGRLVAVGGPEDHWHYGGYERPATITSNGKPSSSVGSRSLTRKVSGSLKKVAGSIKRNDREQRELPASSGDEWKPYDGSKPAPTRDPSTSGQSRSVSRTPSKSSLKPINLDTVMDGKRDSPTTKLSPAAKSSPSPRESTRPSPLSKVRGREHEEDASPSSKWWKLVKRISTGGLREKYTASDTPPPVPALPPNLKTIPPSRTTMDISSGQADGQEVSENGVLLRRFMQSRSSLSGVRPTLSPPSKTPSSAGLPRTSTGNAHPAARSPAGNALKGRASTSVHRPSMATRSSSPGSSDMATSSLSNHNLTSSARSSFSSYGEEIPPVPKPVGQYIMSPSELSRMTKSSESVRSASLPAQHRPRPRTRSRSHTAPSEDASFDVVASSYEERSFPSLPLPPRRANAGAASLAHVHVVQSVPPPLGEFGLKEPPPRPKRSTRRAAPPNVEVPSRSQSMSTVMPPTPQTPRGPPQVRVDAGLLRRPSTGALSYTAARQPSATSPRPQPSASASAPSSAVSQKRSPMTFREMESPRRVLTEQEKADKWDDLLERSAQAGGTLHLGQAESRLMSDDPAVHGDDSFFDGDDSDA
ncbi:hypothetical protein LXA43DRAFT_1081355 [Ganoderma leucocontextum]|nr:hypothetical protein LXA43DRAFT_1081355 [Ganoderma leucocontextum]